MEFEEFEDVEKVRGGPKKQGSGARAVATKTGQVIGIGPTGCRVLSGDDAIQCKPKAGLAVGDFVDLDEAGNVRNIHPRKTTLPRPDPNNPRLERVIAANMDIVAMVVSICWRVLAGPFETQTPCKTFSPCRLALSSTSARPSSTE